MTASSEMSRAWGLSVVPFVLVGVILAGCSTSENEPPEVAQRIIDLVAEQDLVGLVNAVSMQLRPCTLNPEGSPRCDQGDVEGTTYRVFPSGACQGFWTTDVEATMQGVLSAAGQPFAVARLGAPPDWARDPGPPYGEYAIIFAAQSGAQAPDAVAVFVEGDAIVRTQIGCRRADQFLEPGVGEERPEVIWEPE